MKNIKHPAPGGKTTRRTLADELGSNQAGETILDALATLVVLALPFDLDELEAEIAENPALAAKIIHRLTLGAQPPVSIELVERVVRDITGTGAPLLGMAPAAVVFERGAVLARHPARPWAEVEELRAALGSSLRALERHVFSLPPPAVDSKVLH